MKTYYALHLEKYGLMFSCGAKTEIHHDKKVQLAFNNWKSAQPKGNAASMDDYMEDRIKVKITIEDRG